MKKLFSLLFSLVIMLAMLSTIGAVASADIANEHIDDFYWRNTRKFDYTVSGYYYVNSPDGYVTAWTSPSALNFVENIPNGTVLYIQAQYKGWATATYLADGKYVDGNEWIPMSMLTARYSQNDFSRDYAARIDGSSELCDFFADYSLKDTMYFYTYPGSGELCAVLYELDPETPLELEKIFEDDMGRHWGYCLYYTYMDVSGWVCLEAPEKSSMPLELDRQPELICEGVDTSDSQLARLRYDYIISGGVYAGVGAAGAAIIGVAVLIYLTRKRRQKSAEEL